MDNIRKLIGSALNKASVLNDDAKKKKTKTISPSGEYKATSKGDEVKVKRTIKGVFSGAAPVKKTEANRKEYISQQQRINKQNASRIAGNYNKESGMLNAKGTADVYNRIANQKIEIPKNKRKYGDY